MRRKRILFLILLLVIGFASISATLVINGVTSIASNEQDFKIFFSEAILDDIDKSNSIIKDNKQIIDFETNELTLVGTSSILDYEVTNNSRQYDAEVEVHCTAKSTEVLDYIDLTYSIEKEIIPAKERARGTVKATLKKAYTGDEVFDKSLTCTIGANAVEKESANDIILDNRDHYVYGYLLKDGEELTNKLVAVSSANGTKFTRTDVRGMFIIEGLTGGDYSFLVFEDKTEEELSSLSHEELLALASDIAPFNTTNGKIALTNYEVKYSKSNPGTPTTHTLTFDTTGGTTDTFTSTLIEGEPIGHLPSNVEHETLAFVEWQENGNKVSEDNVYNADVTLNANYGDGVARIGEKQFRTLNKAFDYISTPEETTIEVIKANSIPKDITTDKNVILNLNELKVNFNTHKLTNSGNLTINNGMIDANGEYVLENNGTLNITNNTTVNHSNNTNETTVISTITNNVDATMNITSSSINTSYSSYVQNQSIITNYGTMTLDRSNIDSSNGSIYVWESAILNISNSELLFENCIENDRFIRNAGTLNYTDSNTTIKETNTVSAGILNIVTGGTANINSGTLNGIKSKSNTIFSNKDTILNIGSSDKTVDFIGNGTTNYTVALYGETNIVDGTIRLSQGPGIGNFGPITIGNETATPTIIGNTDGSSLISIRGGQENKIINLNLNITNSSGINIFENTKLTIDNVNLEQTSTTYSNRAIQTKGNLIINNGTFKVGETNDKSNGSNGLLEVLQGATTINGGGFDNTNGIGVGIRSDGTLNFGNNTDIRLIGNNTNTYTLYSTGTLNILDGNITFDKGPGIGSAGLLVLGSENTTPTLNSVTSRGLIDVRSEQENLIKNANINAQNNYAINVYKDSKLTIDNANITQTSTTSTVKALQVTGSLTINDGNYKIGEENDQTKGSTGLINGQANSTININGGTFDNTYGTTGLLASTSTTNLNIGENDKTINFINNSRYYCITSNGNLNMPAGTINFSKSSALAIKGTSHIGTSTSTPIINGNPGSRTLSYSDGTEHIIDNAIINASNNSAIEVPADKELTINNIEVNYSNTKSTKTNRAIDVSGKLTLNGGTYNINSDNTSADGLMFIASTSTTNINGGTFNNTYGKVNAIYAEEGSNIIIDTDKEISFIENGGTTGSINSRGNLSILNGTLNAENGTMINVYDNIIIGSENSKPTFNGARNNFGILEIKDNINSKENRIINANMNTTDSKIISIKNTNANLTIKDINLTYAQTTSTREAIEVFGTLVVDGGTFKTSETNTTGRGLIYVNGGRTAMLNSGTFDNTYGKGNLLDAYANSNLTIGAKDKEINFIGNGTNKSIICSRGATNILYGTINGTNGTLVETFSLLQIGSDTETPTINGPTNYTTLLYKDGNEHNIANANITSGGKVIELNDVYPKVVIENINLIQTVDAEISTAVSVEGELIINNGTFKNTEGTRSLGVISAIGSSILTVKEATITDYSGNPGGAISGSGYATINLGEDGKTVNLNGNVHSAGQFYIKGGTINCDYQYEMFEFDGSFEIGNSSTTTTINLTNDFIFARGLSTSNPYDGHIQNVNVTSENGCTFNSFISANNRKLTIDNMNLNLTSISNTVLAASNKTELNINGGSYNATSNDGTGYLIKSRNTTITDGTFKLNGGSSLLSVLEETFTIENGTFEGTDTRLINNSGILNINGGTFRTTTAEENLIYNYGVLNIGKEEKNPILIEDTLSVYAPLLVNMGTTNIYNGEIVTNDITTISQNTTQSGDDGEALASEYTINIFGGQIKNNSSTHATIYMTHGKLNMSGGEVVNNSGNTTISNHGGTAIQTGGISANNYGVTVQ